MHWLGLRNWRPVRAQEADEHDVYRDEYADEPGATHQLPAQHRCSRRQSRQDAEAICDVENNTYARKQIANSEKIETQLG